ncbi:hypothetical protein ABN028_33455 [Actinopolymorpha sp. B17G11]|uniref:DUF4352 domain-containing protein n=1 Tax=Actinopolymorpha sp. B17G11 TaxID=3160861 RepID=UPI0032E3FB39
MNSQIAARGASLCAKGRSRHRLARGVLAVACAATLFLCGCSRPPVPVTMATPANTAKPGTPSTTMVGVGQTFRNGSFEVTVTELTTGVKKYAKELGVAPPVARNGQLIVVRMKAKNVGMAPAQFGGAFHRIVDTRGRRFGPTQVRGFDYRAQLNPDQMTHGVVIFDVAPTVALAHVIVQTDDNAVGRKARTYVAASKP